VTPSMNCRGERWLALTGSPANCGRELSLLPEGRVALKPPEGVTTGLQEQPYSTLPVLAALAPLLPGGGLPKGSVVAVEQPGTLCPALMAGASRAGIRCGVALIVAGAWDGAPVRLHVTRQQWDGIGDRYGRLRARRAEVVAEGRPRRRGRAAHGSGCRARTARSSPRPVIRQEDGARGSP